MVAMTTNDLLAAVTPGPDGTHIGIGMIVLALLVIGGLGYGGYRLTHRVRLSRPPRHTTRPGLPASAAQLTAPAVTPPNGWAVETHALTKHFGATTAVNAVELLVPRGSAFGYLGPNGAGKTTLIRALLGLTRANAGTMALLVYPVPRHRDAALARIGAIVDEPRFHGHLTGRQNLRLLAAAREAAARNRIEPVLDRVGLAQRAGDRVSTYSMGMRQRLGVAAAMLADPELLILDEPMNGLDPAGIAEMRDLIRALVAEGRTVVLSSHLLDEVERTCDAVAIVDRGSIIRQGPISELLAGASVLLQVECSDIGKVRTVLGAGGLNLQLDSGEPVLGITLPPGTSRDLVAEVARQLMSNGIDLYRLQPVQTSLESW